MPRASRAQAELNHRRVLAAASRLLREHGVRGISVPEVMQAAGLTHGGFYKHFASKDDMVAQAGGAAFAERLRDAAGEPGKAPPSSAPVDPQQRRAARRAFLDRYLSLAHRDDPGAGCAAVALAADAARVDPDKPLRAVYADGLSRMADAVQAMGTADGTDGAGRTASRAQGLTDLATMVGAVVLARATAHHDISEEILQAVRSRLLGESESVAPEEPRSDPSS